MGGLVLTILDDCMLEDLKVFKKQMLVLDGSSYG